MYVTLMAETATLDLEQQVAEMDKADQLDAAPNGKVAEGLRKTWRAQARLKIRDLFDIRAKTRLQLLLPERRRG